MKKIVRLTEVDLVRIVKKVISEQPTPSSKPSNYFVGEGLMLWDAIYGIKGEPNHRVKIMGPAKWSGNNIIIPVKSTDGASTGHIQTFCEYGKSGYDRNLVLKLDAPGRWLENTVIPSKEGTALLMQIVRPLCQRFVSNDRQDISNMA